MKRLLMCAVMAVSLSACGADDMLPTKKQEASNPEIVATISCQFNYGPGLLKDRELISYSMIQPGSYYIETADGYSMRVPTAQCYITDTKKD